MRTDDDPAAPAPDDDPGQPFDGPGQPDDPGAARPDDDAAPDGASAPRPDGAAAARPDEAATRPDEAAAPRPDEAALLGALAERETAYGLLQRGTALLARRHHAQAAVILERARRLEPGKGSIVEPLARAYYNGGRIPEAAEAFAQLIEIDPTAAYGHFGLGQSLKRLGRRDEARRHLRIAVAMAPGSKLYRSALERLG